MAGRGHDTCPVRSIAAAEVESLVLGQVRRLLASPELVARTITAVRRENSAAEDLILRESEVIEALGALEPVWDELYPAEQARVLRLLKRTILVDSAKQAHYVRSMVQCRTLLTTTEAAVEFAVTGSYRPRFA